MQTVYLYEYQVSRYKTTQDLNQAQAEARSGSSVWKVELSEENEITGELDAL